MSLTFRVLRTHEEWSALRPAWDELISRQAGDILGADFTSTFLWAETLWTNHLNRSGMEIIVAERGGQLQALLPYYRTSKTVHSIPCRSIAPVTELYSGRCGFILASPQVDLLRELLRSLRSLLGTWDVFVFTLVEGSASARLLQEVVALDQLRIEKIASQKSPYILLDTPWDAYFASLPRKFRWNLRNFEKKMNAAGEVVHRIFESDSDLEQFHSAVQEIEKASWKEEAGTSLTANSLQEGFHALLMNKAASSGWFSGHVLEFRGEPVSYVWGVLFENIFYDFKESYKSTYREFGPGHVLKLSLMQQLFSKRVNFYDYMGACEEYKLRWTDKTYERSTFLLYNNTLPARAALWGSKIKTLLAPRAAAAPVSAAAPEADKSV
jgi:CelD/BcsL family acetyltransferase involved in cellulose biosynthesis